MPFGSGCRCLRPQQNRAPNARWQFSEAAPSHVPRALSRVGPSCHLSNDFFILQEEPVARGNAPLPARGKPDAGSRPTLRLQPRHRGTDTSFHPACVSLLSFPPLCPHSRRRDPALSLFGLTFCPRGEEAQLYFSVVIVFFGRLNDYLAFASVKRQRIR